MKKGLPEDLLRQYGTVRNFRRCVRKRLRIAFDEMDDARFGCAFTPAGKEIQEALDLIKRAMEKCSVRNWGR